MKAVLITEAGEVKAVDVDELQDLQDLCGGWIQGLPWKQSATDTLYLDEEGKIKGYGLNAKATEAMEGCLLPGDYIAGNALICGTDYETGEMADVSSAVLAEWTGGES